MLQDNIVSTSDESIPIVPRNQVTIVVNMNNFYPRRGPLCPHGRIPTFQTWKARFLAQHT